MMQNHLDHGASKKPIKSTLGKDVLVPLMHHDLRDLGSVILFWTIPKECTLSKQGMRINELA